MYQPTAKGYFSGCGGMELGMQQAGVSIIQSLDLDAEATACMQANKHYFSHTILTADIKDKTVLEQPHSDIIIGTYPCTKYSPIADIHGTRTGDDLFLHFFRHIAIEKPEMYVVENVPGMKKFKVVMEAMTKLPDYYVHVFCSVDVLNWFPQKRNRLILNPYIQTIFFPTFKQQNHQTPWHASFKPNTPALKARSAFIQCMISFMCVPNHPAVNKHSAQRPGNRILP